MAAEAAAMGRTSWTNSLYLDDKWKLLIKDIFFRSSRSASSNRSSRQKRCAFSRKCAKLVKEQWARLYIIQRCVIMLVFWRDYIDESK